MPRKKPTTTKKPEPPMVSDVPDEVTLKEMPRPLFDESPPNDVKAHLWYSWPQKKRDAYNEKNDRRITP